MEKKHYLIYGHGGSYNHGGEAITSCTIKLLRSISPECRITLSTHFPEQDEEFAIDADEIVTRDITGTSNAEVYRSTLEKITADTIAIQVGGDNYCYRNWQRYAQIHEATKNCGGTSILWGTSIDEQQLDEELLGVLRTHDLILARECLTFENLKKRGLNNVLHVSDIAFSMEAEPIEFSLDNYVVINLSPLVCRKNPEAEKAINQLMEYILLNTSYSIALLPHVVVAADNDYDVLSALKWKNSNRVVLVSDKLSARQYKSIISKAQLCVAARTHVTIAAYSCGVPTLAIGYSTKAKGIALDLDVIDYVVDIEAEFFSELLLSKFRELLMRREEIHKKLKQKMPDYKERAFQDVIISMLKGEIV